MIPGSSRFHLSLSFCRKKSTHRRYAKRILWVVKKAVFIVFVLSFPPCYSCEVSSHIFWCWHSRFAGGAGPHPFRKSPRFLSFREGCKMTSQPCFQPIEIALIYTHVLICYLFPHYIFRFGTVGLIQNAPFYIYRSGNKSSLHLRLLSFLGILLHSRSLLPSKMRAKMVKSKGKMNICRTMASHVSSRNPAPSINSLSITLTQILQLFVQLKIFSSVSLIISFRRACRQLQLQPSITMAQSLQVSV